jgi:hypothetical protein
MILLLERVMVEWMGTLSKLKVESVVSWYYGLDDAERVVGNENKSPTGQTGGKEECDGWKMKPFSSCLKMHTRRRIAL